MLPALFTKRHGHPRKLRTLRLGPKDIAITWIGHASFLIQTRTDNILIDPLYANWILGVKRLKKPGLDLRDLPPSNLVLVTHAHFDHLHPRTLRRVACGQPIVVPEHCGGLVSRMKFGSVIEMKWWETQDFGGLKVTFTPAKHWGARTLVDGHRAFGGFVIEYQGRRVFHSGDSAYFHGYKEIGQKLRPDIALIPIGAYETISGRDNHIGPEDAVRAFEDLGADWFIPMHYGTFRLGHEPIEEPLQRLFKAALKHAVASRIRILDPGKAEVF
nr:MBL fold metallo-hydrolase [Oscillatoria laete-virens]